MTTTLSLVFRNGTLKIVLTVFKEVFWPHFFFSFFQMGKPSSDKLLSYTKNTWRGRQTLLVVQLQVALTLTLREAEGSQISSLSSTQEARKIDKMKSKIRKGRVETVK